MDNIVCMVYNQTVIGFLIHEILNIGEIGLIMYPPHVAPKSQVVNCEPCFGAVNVNNKLQVTVISVRL